MSWLLAAVALAAAAAAPHRHAQAGVLWQGTMRYPCVDACPVGVKWLVHDGPIAITIDNTTASIDWIWTVQPDPPYAVKYCTKKEEVGLKVQSSAPGRWFARGTGEDPQYYSFEATVSALHVIKTPYNPFLRPSLFSSTLDMK